MSSTTWETNAEDVALFQAIARNHAVGVPFNRGMQVLAVAYNERLCWLEETPLALPERGGILPDHHWTAIFDEGLRILLYYALAAPTTEAEGYQNLPDLPLMTREELWSNCTIGEAIVFSRYGLPRAEYLFQQYQILCQLTRFERYSSFFYQSPDYVGAYHLPLESNWDTATILEKFAAGNRNSTSRNISSLTITPKYVDTQIGQEVFTIPSAFTDRTCRRQWYIRPAYYHSCPVEYPDMHDQRLSRIGEETIMMTENMTGPCFPGPDIADWQSYLQQILTAQGPAEFYLGLRSRTVWDIQGGTGWKFVKSTSGKE